jgi:hypothetical protein
MIIFFNLLIQISVDVLLKKREHRQILKKLKSEERSKHDWNIEGNY